MQKISNTLKLSIGLVLSLLFLYLAFRQVNLRRLVDVLKNTNLPIITLAIFSLFLSHWFRALRHRYLLEPLKHTQTLSLFSALMIGYMANAILPAHLGEFLRAYAIGKKEGISGSSVFATIVVERVVDVLTLVLLMGLVLMVYPFPNTMKISAYLTVALAIGIVGILAFLKLKPEPTLGLIRTVTKPLPHKMGNSLFSMVESFGAGITALQRGRSYIIFTVLSIIIWCCYAGVLVLGFYALDLIKLYNIPIGASLVVLIMTTVAILVPSAPGYIGTYHWLCMLALGFFGVPKSAALGYAIIIHAISGIPVALVGVAFALREGISVSKIGEEGALKKMAVS